MFTKAKQKKKTLIATLNDAMFFNYHNFLKVSTFVSVDFLVVFIWIKQNTAGQVVQSNQL